MATPDAQCRVCRSPVAPSEIFCPRCTAPVGVAALAELDEVDRRIALAALFRAAAAVLELPPPTDTGEPSSPQHDAALLEAYLSAQWLRPETALIQYAEAAAAIAAGFADPAAGPRLDLGCGDGVHASLMAGFRFAGDFDCFQCVDPSARDVYDHFDAAQFAARIERGANPVEIGVDIKPTAVRRAAALGTFGAVVRADATRLPIADESVGVVFSNMLRDLGDPLPAALREVRRVLRPGGRVMLSAMTPAYRAALHFEPAARAAADPALASRLARLDRGRAAFCRQQLPPERWASLLADAGLRLHRVIGIVGPAVIGIWDTGLRPFAVSLLRDRARLAAMKAPAVKWFATIANALHGELLHPAAPCMNLIVAVREQ